MKVVMSVREIFRVKNHFLMIFQEVKNTQKVIYVLGDHLETPKSN